MDRMIVLIRRELREASDEKTRNTAQSFFKEEIRCHGVKTAVVRKIAKEFFKRIKDSGKEAIFEQCERLWRSGYMEESFIACEWSYSVRDAYEPGDLDVFHRWIDEYVGNWASCDTLCNHTVGALVDRYPEKIEALKKWTGAKNRWLRRGAAVSLVIPARQGKFLADILSIADALLADGDDMVQKGYGWMLKQASLAHQKEVFEYVMKNKSSMPRTALRYAIEKMPREMKAQAMKKCSDCEVSWFCLAGIPQQGKKRRSASCSPVPQTKRVV